MKKLGLLIMVLSFIGAIPCFAQPQTKAKPSIGEQTKGTEEAPPCNCGKSGKPQKVAREKAGTLAGQDEKAKEATGAMGSGTGEQPVSKDKTTK
ncbi:MAG: hypothetical protein HYY61_04220 [Deltaproteobacteria bacterium]|nr:hypothetical protein [Deltaproteobacteria bacterium]